MTGLTRGQLRDLLATISSGEPIDGPEKQYQLHDWRRCRFFNDQELNIIKDFFNDVASSIDRIFEGLCRRKTQSSIASMTQQYAYQLPNMLAVSKDDCCLVFGLTSDRPDSICFVPAQGCLAWVGWMLGNPEPSEASQGLSDLDKILLGDCVKTLLSALNQQRYKFNVIPSESLQIGRIPQIWGKMDELLCVWVSIREPDQQETKAALVLPCKGLSQIVGRTHDEKKSTTSQKDADVLMALIDDLLVRVTVTFGRVSLKVEELVRLEKDDIIVLDRSMQDPAEVLVNGRAAFDAIPVRYKGQLAVQIVGN